MDNLRITFYRPFFGSCRWDLRNFSHFIAASWAASKGKQVRSPICCRMFYQDFLSSFQPPHLAVAFHAGRVGMRFWSLERNIRIWTTELCGSPPAWLYCPKYWQAFKSMRLACKNMLLKTEMSMVKDGVFFGLSKGSPIEPCEKTSLSLFFTTSTRKGRIIELSTM